MTRTRIKICGLRDPAHALIAAREGADAIGLVFYGDSPRNVCLEAAAAMSAALPPYVTPVGLFVNETVNEIERILARVPLGLLQFQGDETPEFCDGFGVPYVRAVRMEQGVDLLEYAGRFKRAKALLLDAHVPGLPGGTGTKFDWSRIPRSLPIPLILSGGLHAGNVADAIREVRPWAVDVSSGVEASRGVKDPAKIVEFIRSVQVEDAASR
ncbi:MAG TPA: phosphoribosylanthranilate isomerase [Usitatibacter sp.]|nr:phosphoribosylanthranilate isomerase [Usitatibacter sp.]